jgi:hypothetical protein
MEFLQKFMGLMGDHMMKLGGGETAKSVAPPRLDRSSRVLIEEVADVQRSSSTSSHGRLVPSTSDVPVDPSASKAAQRGDLSAVFGSGGLSADDVVRAAQSGQLAGGDAEVRAVLSNREVMGVFSDPVIQRVLAECAADGSKLARYMRDPDVARKLQLLAKHGLIGIGQ